MYVCQYVCVLIIAVWFVQFLSGVSVSSTTVDSANTLLIVNGRTNMTGKPIAPVRAGPPPVIEVAHMLASSQLPAAVRK